jgi:hypothetical protein
MVNPLCRAHERTSALLGEPTSAAAGGVALRARTFLFAERDLAPLITGDVVSVAVVDRAGILALCAEGFFATEARSPGSGAETISVTPYKAPTTRIASSRASLESKVSFNAVAFRHVET